MKITKKMVSESKYSIKCPHSMKPIGISVHNTDNDAPAINEISYMISNDLYVSFHYAIDDVEVVQGIPENRNAWHSGDGMGPGNASHIGIEICWSASGGERFIKAEKNAAKFIALKLKEYNWDISRVKKHQDFDGKYCPRRTLDMGWQRFLDMIQSELNLLNTGFTDVPTNTWYTEAVEYAVAKKITNGTSANTFAPNDTCTRAQAVTFLWRYYGSPQVASGKNPFVDVKSTDFYYKAVLWAVSKGITAGIDETHFAPNDSCTRAQIATFMWRAAGKPNASTGKNFVDVPADAWYTDAVRWGVYKKIISGLDTTHFGPDTPCTRAQMVTFLHRLSTAK